MRYIALDFEATCDEPDNPDPQEIIEFPAVVVGSETGADPAEFHAFVRPVAHPRLTRFCVGLTGIRQEQVDRGDTFPEVLAQFEDWLEEQGDFQFVTCGDWDLGSLLPRQCAQHRLPVPAWARSWANLKRIFAQHFPHASRRTSLRAMAAFLGAPHGAVAQRDRRRAQHCPGLPLPPEREPRGGRLPARLRAGDRPQPQGAGRVALCSV